MNELAVDHVVIHDPFWSPRLEVNAHSAIFHQWEMLEASGCIDNFRIAVGEKQGFRLGRFFADSDAYKWLEAAARILPSNPDPRLGDLVSDLIALLGRCQTSDGYIFTYNQIHFPGARWTNLQIEHELYCHGHLIEAGVSHHQATGRSELLEIVIRAALLLVKDFLGAAPQRTPGHEEVELALLRLYHLTGNSAYLDLAQHFLEQRGRMRYFALSLIRQNASAHARSKVIRQQRQASQSENPDIANFKSPPDNFAKHPPLAKLRWYASALSGKYFQQHTPIRQQTVPVGHSVRFAYLQTATAMLLRACSDRSLLPALEQAWEHMVLRRMYLTGGIGSLPVMEGFGKDYELDPEFAYAETCAALASLFWNWQMAMITSQAKYSELFEWQLYNAAAVGMGWSGENYLYNNPLTCQGGIVRQAWYEVPCCPSNLSRTWAWLGEYVFTTTPDSVWIHQYIGSQAALPLERPVQIELISELPWNGQVRLKLTLDAPLEFGLYLRMPNWTNSPQVEIVSDESPDPISVDLSRVETSDAAERGVTVPSQGSPAGGYDPRQSRFVLLRRNWSSGDEVNISFDLPILIRRVHSKVKGHRGKAALTRGPLVYCLEDVDNPGVDIFTARLDIESLHHEFSADLFGGTMLLCAKTTNGEPLTFIPYQLWGNRGESRMTVWINT